MNKLRVFWCTGLGIGNIGDVLTPWMLRAQGVPHAHAKIEGKGKYLMVGSLMCFARPGDTIWGTGTNHSPLPKKAQGPWNILAVRGPLTRAAILDAGHDCPEIYGDPGLLMPRFYNPQIQKGEKVGIVPHQVDLGLAEKHYGYRGRIITPYRKPTQVRGFIDEMLACERIVSSSLHGLVLAHAYGIPARWMKFSDGVFGEPKDIKFRDYFLSVGIKPYDPYWPVEQDWAPVDLQIDLEPLWEARPWKTPA